MTLPHFCEFPDRLVGVLTRPEFRLTEPIPLKEHVVEWCTVYLRGGVEIDCIGHDVPNADGLVLDYYISFEHEVDMLVFKMKWFDAE